MNRASLAEGNRIHFLCPGCETVHTISYGDDNSWTWNGSLELPTFSPSVLTEGMTYKRVGGTDEDPTFEDVSFVCHSFVSEGVIQFLSDCTHSLANEYVELPLWPNDDERSQN